MDWIKILTDPAVQKMIAAVVAAILAWRNRTAVVNFGKRVTGYGSVDNRDSLADALTLLWDNEKNVKGKACNESYNAACETLSKFILRPCKKQEEVTS